MEKASSATHPCVTALDAFAHGEESLRAWAEHLEHVPLADGEVLFRQGEPVFTERRTRASCCRSVSWGRAGA
jgi:hypothetical protein